MYSYFAPFPLILVSSSPRHTCFSVHTPPEPLFRNLVLLNFFSLSPQYVASFFLFAKYGSSPKPEEGGNILLRNFDNDLPDYTASH
jgi:hypothetical protein